ncbi:hypothetical protein LHJ74_23710 [Streptomyces sp. N2-109]|uniref:Transporter n=1 Tax=Streptomyces gossypii TaxID=2883101 RepID=A0ABT2JYB2_9ACTN|nr:hypothetical protein [Streptomyces gossypii]MCT2592883.1 hypothetical protein [Streptomyces gossypii]
MATPTPPPPTPTTAPVGTEHPVPRRAEITAHLIPLILLPQCLWRLPFAVGFDMGMEDMDGGMPAVWLAIPYVLGLSLVTEALALLCFGLVRRWGEVVPSWVPVIGDRHIPPYAAIVPATLGGLGATAFWAPTWVSWFGVGSSAGYDNGWWDALATACITPGTLFGPLVLALTYAYWVRRCRPAGRSLNTLTP